MANPNPISPGQSTTRPGSDTSRQHGAMEYTTPPCDLDEVRLYRLERIRNELRKHDYAGGLFFDPVNTRYATDTTNMQIWCAHYETRCVFVATDGPVVVFDYGNYPHLVEDVPTVNEYRALSSFYYFTAGDRVEAKAEKFADDIAELVTAHGGGNRRLAVDRLSWEGVRPLLARQIEIFDGLKVTEHARVIKSDGELTLMRAAIDVCEQGMTSMYEALEPGITENALWAKLHQTNIALGGEWIETRLLCSGERTNPWFRECSMKTINAGEMVCFDTDLIGPYGYCADISRAWLCGDNEPTPEQRRLYSLAYEQIQHNIDVLQPGKTFREVAFESWQLPDEFLANRYGSLIHGVGLADEWPSIKHSNDFDTKGYDGTLQPGMTLCVESYIGTDGGAEGVKLEEQILITETGTETLSTWPFESKLLN